MWFSAILTADLDSLPSKYSETNFCASIQSIYKDTSKFALAYEQKKIARMVNLHLVVKISTGHNSRTVRDIKKILFSLVINFKKQ